MSGAHVNIADEKGRTPLHIAVELGDPVLSDRVLIGGFNVLTCVLPLCLCGPLSCALEPNPRHGEFLTPRCLVGVSQLRLH